MQFLLLFKADSSLFDPSHVEQVFRANPGFIDLRFNTPSGDLIACTYAELDDWTLINLDGDRDSIVLNSTGTAALQAVLIIQQSLKIPMRVYNDSYTFDLTFSDLSTVEELEAAMDKAKTS